MHNPGEMAAQTRPEAQADSLETRAGNWVTAGDEEAQSPMQLWLNKALIPFKVVYKDNFGFSEEEVDLQYEPRQQQHSTPPARNGTGQDKPNSPIHSQPKPES
jgi:hypothetical protein